MLTLLGCVGVFLYLSLESELVGQFDDALLTKAKALHSVLRRTPSGTVEFDFSDDTMPEFHRAKAPEYFEVWRESGEVMERSRSLHGLDLKIVHDSLANRAQFTDLILNNGTHGRCVQLNVHSTRDDQPEGEQDDKREAQSKNQPTKHGDESFLIIFARERSSLDQTLAKMAWSMGGTAVFFALGVGVLFPWLVSRSLRSLNEIATMATRIDARSLTQRFPVSTMPSELQPICLRLNDSLERLQRAFERESRFSADVAHELRTPIAELRLLAEVALKFPPDAQAAGKSFADTLNIAMQMQAIVNSLLEFLKSDTKLEDQAFESVELVVVIDEAWRTVEDHACRKKIRMQKLGLSLPSLSTNPSILRRIVCNLIENAVEYSPVGSSIESTCSEDSSYIHWELSNPAPNLSTEDVDSLALPFWRKDAARTGGEHLGLGLSIVNSYVRQINAEIVFVAESGMLRLRVIFPKTTSGDR